MQASHLTPSSTPSIRALLIVLLVAIATLLTAAPVGKIRFILGDVQYKENQNAPWKKASLNQSVEATASFKTGVDSKVEIIFNSNQSFIIQAKNTIAVKKIQQDMQSQQKWTSQVREKASNMSLQNKQKNTSVAGIRREEAEIKKSDLYWYIPPRQEIQEAIDLMDLKEFQQAIPKFELVIEQGPLKKEAEIARTMLIIIYDELKDKPRQKLHYDALKRDFPQSELLRSMPELK
ncbi:MAG TPA: hypothetical protein PKX36_01615 [Candidatus Cloacimonadota bacterium]|nr:hypothetical protein [Candidatus Cloacimonadota bacterium]